MGIEFELIKEHPEDKPDVTVIHLSGWLDAHSEGRLVAAVQQAKDDGAKYAVLDLAGVDTITSAGIRALQQSYRLMTPGDRKDKLPRLKLCGGSPQVYQVLSITGVLISIPMYEGIDIAIDSFGK
jgi:anti-anti-sigma factor